MLGFLIEREERRGEKKEWRRIVGGYKNMDTIMPLVYSFFLPRISIKSV